MVNWKSKYLEMKLKYINAKNNLKGGMLVVDPNHPKWSSLPEEKKMAYLISLNQSSMPYANQTANFMHNVSVPNITIYVDYRPYRVSPNVKLTRTMLHELIRPDRDAQIYMISDLDMDNYYPHQKMTPEEEQLASTMYGRKFVGFQDYPKDGLVLSSIVHGGRWIRGSQGEANEGRSLAEEADVIIYGISDPDESQESELGELNEIDF
jgi:hypothetical protein